MPNTPRLAPENQFPQPALDKSVVVPPEPNQNVGTGTWTLYLASAADSITPWGVEAQRRDWQLREFWPTEPYLAGALTSSAARDAGADWRIKHSSDAIERAVTDMLHAALAGDKIGWIEFVKKFSLDLRSQDNGAFIEVIREEGMDANSKFKGAMAPVVGIGHLDSNQCVRTGNPDVPVLYKDRNGMIHKMRWYEVIPFAEYSSPIERMNGVGYCSVTRTLRLAQILRSSLIYKDEKISGRNPKDIHIVGGVAQKSIEDAMKRTQENASNSGNMRFIENVVLASLDPEKPVSATTIELASLPDGYDLDKDMQWYMVGLALNFGTDYQEFAPLPGGNIGSASQSITLSKKSSGKGPRNWMDALTESFKNYGVLPRGAELEFDDKNKQEELENQEIRTKAAEEAAIMTKILPPKVIMESLVRRGIYDKKDLDGVPEEWWTRIADKNTSENKGQTVGARGGNTSAENATRVDSGAIEMNAGASLRKEEDD